uniref:ribosomal protein S9 n=1 Tax=Halimeda opuntia TaxID=118223 RepID=UPI00211569EF|nr:ribosomal protein S9 [Halimeda opuntia]UTN43209.1 ribosomal protein S9 [Halimeda opuntia]
MTYYGIGRRKSAIAQVFLVDLYSQKGSSGSFQPAEQSSENWSRLGFSSSGVTKFDIQINGSIFTDYFQNDISAIQYIKQLVQAFNQFFKIKIKVSGGGKTSQKEAIHLALARAFCQIDPSFKKPNLLTQDSRIKERKKYGLKKARKAPQYSKR